MRLLIAYDGSPTATAAVRAAASLFRDPHAHIATVPSDPTVHAVTSVAPLATTARWPPDPPVHAVTSVAPLPGVSPDALERTIGDLTAEARREAGATAEQAVEQMRTLGLEAEPVTVRPSEPAWAALLDA